MKILYCGPHSNLVNFLIHEGNVLQITENPLTDTPECDLLISYGYQHIIRKNVLDKVRAINLHISFLPWNRGCSPNFWSWLDNTPKGVTIHYMDEGIDTGDIIYQKEVTFTGEETLRSSYSILKNEIENLFFKNWRYIKTNSCPRIQQPPVGSKHTKKDLEDIKKILYRGWDTPVKDISKAMADGEIWIKSAHFHTLSQLTLEDFTMTTNDYREEQK